MPIITLLTSLNGVETVDLQYTPPNLKASYIT